MPPSTASDWLGNTPSYGVVPSGGRRREVSGARKRNRSSAAASPFSVRKAPVARNSSSASSSDPPDRAHDRNSASTRPDSSIPGRSASRRHVSARGSSAMARRYSRAAPPALPTAANTSPSVTRYAARRSRYAAFAAPVNSSRTIRPSGISWLQSVGSKWSDRVIAKKALSTAASPSPTPSSRRASACSADPGGCAHPAEAPATQTATNAAATPRFNGVAGAARPPPRAFPGSCRT